MAGRDHLSTAFAALADPTRREILSRLSHGPMTVGELAEPFTVSRPAISQHLRVLEDAGFIERTVTAQWRTCALRSEALDDVAAWVDTHRAHWDERFDLLAERLARTRPGPRAADPAADEGAGPHADPDGRGPRGGGTS